MATTSRQIACFPYAITLVLMLACGTSALLALQAPASAEQAAADAASAGFVPGKGHEIVGAVATRHAKEIAGSRWSVGAETMDRDFTVYANWKTYLGPLGATAALTLVLPAVESVVAPLAAQAASCTPLAVCTKLKNKDCTGLPICESRSLCCKKTGTNKNCTASLC